MHQDKVNNLLEIGDEVAFSFSRSTQLGIGTVIGLSPRRVLVEYNGDTSYHQGERLLKVYRSLDE